MQLNRRALLAGVGTAALTHEAVAWLPHGNGTLNTVPQIASASITPSTGITVGTTLSLTISYMGGTWTSNTYAWKSSGTTVGTGATYIAASGDIGNTITCTITPTGPAGTGSPYTTASVGPVTSGATPPQIASASITPSTGIVVGTTLSLTITYSGGTWSSNTYAWKSAGTTVGTSATYNAASGDVGNTITCTITPTGPGGSGSAYTTAAVGPVTSGTLNFTSVTLSNAAYVNGSASGTVVGNIQITLSNGSSYTGSAPFLSGTDASSFQVTGSGSNWVLETNGVISGNKSITITVTQTGVSNSPLTTPFTITGVGAGNFAVTVAYPGDYAGNYAAGTYTYSTTGGTNQTVTPASSMGTFTESISPQTGGSPLWDEARIRIQRSDFPLEIWIAIKTMRIGGTKYYSVIGRYGAWNQPTVVQPAGTYAPILCQNVISGPQSYTASVTGDWTSGTITIGPQWAWSMWRANSWGYGAPPWGLQTAAALVSAKLMPQFANFGITPSTNTAGTYTPMGNTGLPYTGEETGPREDLGFLNGWTAADAIGRTTTTTNNVLAIAESGATLPWLYWDTTTGRLVDIVNDHPTLSQTGSGDKLTPLSFGGTIQLVIDGTPNSVVPNANPTEFDDMGGGPGHSSWRIYADINIPSSGTVTITATPYGGTSNAIAPTPPMVINANPSNVSSVTYVANSFLPDQPYSIDSSHFSECAIYAYLITGDPYFLEIIHAGMIYMKTENNGGALAFGQIRGTAWSIRNSALAAALTAQVTSTATWLLPSSVMSTLDAATATALTPYVTGTAPEQTVFHIVGVGSSSGTDQVNRCTETYDEMWENAYFVGSLAWAAWLLPSRWATAFNWAAQNAIQGLDPSSGSCTYYNTAYVTQFAGDTGYDAPADNGTLTAAGIANGLAACSHTRRTAYSTWSQYSTVNLVKDSLGSCPTFGTVGNNDQDYPGGQRASLALCQQAYRYGVPGAVNVATLLAARTSDLISTNAIYVPSQTLEAKWCITST